MQKTKPKEVWALAGGGANERPGSDHVIWGPIRGIGKKCLGRGHKKTRYTERTLQLYERIGLRADSLKKFNKNCFEICMTTGKLGNMPISDLGKVSW